MSPFHPALRSHSPGLTKFDCPSSLLLRSEGRKLDGWTNGEPVFIVMRGGLVVIIMEAELCRVAGGEKILEIKVYNSHILIAFVEYRIQLAVGFLLEHRKIDQIVLDTVGSEIPEQP